jgi:hypothetical protein
MSIKQLNKNKIIMACAGFGKTTLIVEAALKITTENVLITTYTNENVDQINQFIIKMNGFMPANIYVLSWFTFLLRDGVRPYQNIMSPNERARSIYFQQTLNRFHKKDNYFTSLNDIYSQKISEFVFECNKKCSGLITKRIEKIYPNIFIDELQDFAGYDLNFFEQLFKSKSKITMVGDSRQATFSTNNSSKNKKYKKTNIYDWVKVQEKAGDVSVDYKNECWRCNQDICNFSDTLFPDLPKTISKNLEKTGHDGIFNIDIGDVVDYIKEYSPVILKYDKRTDTLGYKSINIGLSKGRTYERIIIFPTKTMLAFLNTKDISQAGDLSKFYVAVTRARYSVAFVFNK